MNPVRTLGPAVAVGNYKAIWIYLTAPILGALIGAGVYSAVKLPDEDRDNHPKPSRIIWFIFFIPSNRLNHLEYFSLNRLIGSPAYEGWFVQRKCESSDKSTKDVGNSVLGRCTCWPEKTQFVGNLLSGAGSEWNNRSDPDAPAADERVASSFREKRWNDSNEEAEEYVVELIRGYPIISFLHSFFQELVIRATPLDLQSI